jgi:hypothetical protein
MDENWWDQGDTASGIPGAGSHNSPVRGRLSAWLRLQQPGARSKLSVLAGAGTMLLITACLAGLLSARANILLPASGIDPSTPSPAVTIIPAPSTTAGATGTATAKGGSGASSATILIQAAKVQFTTGFKVDPSEILIDTNSSVLIATDGTGQVAGFLKTFDWAPSTGFRPVVATPCCIGMGAAAHMVGNQADYYYVPSDCTTGYTDDLYARGDATQRLNTQIDDYERSTQLDAQELFGRFPTAYPVTYDPASTVCSPAAGYQQATMFYYAASMPAHVTLPFFKFSDVVAYRRQQAIAHAPANFVFDEFTGGCNNQFKAAVSSTQMNFRCDMTGWYHWLWTPQIARTLAGQIAGKDPATARNILAAYPGADIYRAQGISFQLVGGATLPSDPSKITFKVYDWVVVGANDVQTTGTPQIVP